MRTLGKKAAAGAALAACAVASASLIARLRRRIELDCKTVLITGGSRGLGLALARELASHGARLALCARDTPEIERAIADLEHYGTGVLGIPCDVTDRTSVEQAVGDVAERWGDVDVLINNAGVIQVGPLDVMTTDDFETAIRTHFWGPLHAMLAVLPGMRRRQAGRIVNISSVGGKIAVPHLLPYVASKFALTGLSEGMRAELAMHGIYVTTVIPGLMRTGSHLNAYFKGDHRAEFAWFSIGGALPLLSTSAESAARQIVRACRYGDAEVILTLPAQLAVRFHDLWPSLTAAALDGVNRFLPGPGNGSTHSLPGRQSTSAVSPSLVTRLSDQAAVRNNE